MIKFIVSMLLIMLLAFACGLYLPWWSIAVASFVVSISIYQPPFRSFLNGFLAVLLLWLILILLINSSNHNILAPKVSAVIGFGETLLIVMSCVIGAVVGGFGALTGSLLRRLFLARTADTRY